MTQLEAILNYLVETEDSIDALGADLEVLRVRRSQLIARATDLGARQTDIGEALGISRQRVAQLQQRSTDADLWPNRCESPDPCADCAS